MGVVNEVMSKSKFACEAIKAAQACRGCASRSGQRGVNGISGAFSMPSVIVTERVGALVVYLADQSDIATCSR